MLTRQRSKLAFDPGVSCNPASAGLFLCLSSLLVSARTAEPQFDVCFGSFRWNSVGLLQDKSCTHSNDYAFSIRHGQVIGEFADVNKKKSID